MLRIIRNWIELQRRRRAMGRLLLRGDDHLLRDIGLTRDELRALLEDWRDAPGDVAPWFGRGLPVRPPDAEVPEAQAGTSSTSRERCAPRFRMNATRRAG